MVDILMATYNGEAFVEEQVRSIMAQSFTNWRLLIHDDGSTDQTIAIIQQLQQEDSRIVLINDNVCNLGVARNFIHLVTYATARYCMFCDQDDIWLPNKVETMIRAISDFDQTIPQVLYSNAYLWNNQRGVISDKNTLTYPTTIRQTLFLNTGIQGAASIFNYKMCEIIRQPLQFYAMHDHVLLLAGICFGEVHYLHQSLMFYRQHDNNVTGNAPGSIAKKIQLMWANRYVPLVSSEHLKGLRAFYGCFQSNISTNDKQLINVFLSLPEKSWFARLKTIVQYRFQLFDSTILLIVKFLLRRYI